MKPLITLAATLCAATALVPATAQAQSAEPMSAQDLVTLARLGTVAAAPDGKTAAITVTTTDPASYKRTARLQIVSLAKAGQGGAPFWDGASEPAYGPDGTLYVLASVAPGQAAPDGAKTQVWALPAGGAAAAAAARQVTSFKADVAGFKLSPDGKRLLVWGDVARDCPTLGCDKDGNAALPGPGTGRLYRDGSGFVRHWDAWETPGNYSRAFMVDLDAKGVAGDRVVALDGPVGTLTGDTPTKTFGGGEELSWAADSKSVFFVARQADRHEPLSTNLDVWHSPLDGSAPHNLTEGNKATDTLPAASPDGKWLAYAAMARPGYEADRQVLTLRNLQTGEVRALTQAWDRSVASIAWSPDSRTLLVTANDVLDNPVFRVDLAGKVTRLALSPDAKREGHIGTVIPLKDGRLVFTRDSIAGPAELYVAAKGKRGVRLTDVGTTALAARAPVVTQRFSFAGANGDTVWGYVTKPAGLTGKLPSILYVHGGPQGSFNDAWSTRWNPRVVASQGYAVVAIDFHGSTGYGQAFTDSINQDWGGKPLEDLQKGFAAAARLDAQVDPANACAMGASYGGYMMNWIQGKWADGFKCLVNHNGVFDSRAMAYSTEELWFDEWEHGGKPYYEDPAAYEKWNPVNHVADWKTPMLVVLGEKDFRIPYSQGLGAYTALQRKGVPAELLVFPDENHWVLKPRNSLQWHNTVFDWLGRWLKK
ncbi:dipeptidyl aminopeptidase/acylaminoacyl peptidase [Novosphingobium kunmingense]|uniref:Dipeptidyl aminopeptidase/acylaminoacyl peptidase n=1 Tax=Novosphingobium kunmingense TaxID=1211806 RepID=A0A2N0H4Z1_9SPHN|nr:S9 family peptidase [Novosphingobium kunmingense]PKB13995.1 dipeptidyl aminopeptidase/acylaminoacyl peptidase [Novosphingobium kunmingense]